MTNHAMKPEDYIKRVADMKAKYNNMFVANYFFCAYWCASCRKNMIENSWLSNEALAEIIELRTGTIKQKPLKKDKQISPRDTAILDLRQAWFKCKEIAKIYGLTISRIQQIVKKWTTRIFIP